MWARLKSLVGFTADAIPSVASATALPIPDNATAIKITGTTAIASFDTGAGIQPGRILRVFGNDGTGSAFTDTAIASTSNGKLHLSASLTLALGGNITFTQWDNGAWQETARSLNG